MAASPQAYGSTPPKDNQPAPHLKPCRLAEAAPPSSTLHNPLLLPKIRPKRAATLLPSTFSPEHRQTHLQCPMASHLPASRLKTPPLSTGILSSHSDIWSGTFIRSFFAAILKHRILPGYIWSWAWPVQLACLHSGQLKLSYMKVSWTGWCFISTAGAWCLRSLPRASEKSK